MKAKNLTKETVLDHGATDRGFPEFRVGDTIEVSQKIKEGEKERIQLFKGDVIAFHNNGIATTFTVRKMGVDNVGVERIYPYYSPLVDSIALVKQGKVRRSRLYYIRDRVGKAARIEEKILTKEQKIAAASAASVKNKEK